VTPAPTNEEIVRAITQATPEQMRKAMARRDAPFEPPKK
jgi:hypothetical protein